MNEVFALNNDLKFQMLISVHSSKEIIRHKCSYINRKGMKFIPIMVFFCYEKSILNLGSTTFQVSNIVLVLSSISIGGAPEVGFF